MMFAASRGKVSAMPAALLLSFACLTSPVAAQDPASLAGDQPPAGAIWLDSLDIGKMTSGWEGHPPLAGKSVEGKPLMLGGTTYLHGIGTHARSDMVVDLRGAAKRFVSMVGVDDEKPTTGSVTFVVLVDGKRVASSGRLRGGDKPKLLSVDLTGAKRLTLRLMDAGDGIDSDHGDWAGAALELAPGATVRPVAIDAPHIPVVPARMAAMPADPKPAIHGPQITGSTPGRPFLYMIPATGEGPLSFSIARLPAGLRLDTQTGIISGSLKSAGVTESEVTVKGPKGSGKRRLTIVGGAHKLSLTPPMGWNSWNCWAGAVDDAKVRAAADWMLKSGLAAHGFQYVNIDDTWEGQRDAGGEILTNKKFPSMRGLSDYVHSKGLKLGIYSSPGPTTCAGFVASYQHEDQDAATYAKWGIDYLKHDWCSYGNIAQRDTAPELTKQQKPYLKMRQSLDKADRDIVYSLCQYGMANVWEWGASSAVRANCWRTTGDITDNWESLHGIYSSQNGHEKFAGPGHWNDPDMLIVGKVGWGPSLHETRLLPNEQLLHISLWCLLSSPLLIGCDMSQMSDLTVSLLSNDEILEINQDPLGKPAGRVSVTGDLEVWARPLFDGAKAVGLVNAGDENAKVTVKWSDIGVGGKQPVRDLWLHKDVGSFESEYSVMVPAHGCVVVKIGRPNPNARVMASATHSPRKAMQVASKR